MYKHNETVKSLPNEYRPTHRGIGVVVLHPTTGEVLITGHYETGQPMAYRPFMEMLNSLQAGRILVLAAPGDWRSHMNEASANFLTEYIDGWLVDEVCIGEMWAGVGLINGPLWAETLTTVANYVRPSRSSPIYMAVTVPKSPKKNRCEWYSDPKQEDRARFCETYEGYGDFCSCDTTEIISPADAPPLEMKEQIPIVIATARRQSKVLKQIQQLWTQAGGGNTSILLSVDGLQKSGLIGLQAVYHLNPAALRTLSRISQHIKFSIFQAFKLNPEANKIIVLEDDLVLSPDFISYFHQTAPLLDADKTIFCINAYNYNSFLPTAIDTSRLYREEVLPAYGWMITRELAEELLVDWPTMTEFADWDWYIRARIQRGRDIVTPEVPRTYHKGYGGYHITGWEQSAYLDRRALNADPDAKVNISYLTKDAYEAYLESELRNATVLEIKEHPCDKEYIPKEKVGSFVVYFYGEYETDTSFAYFTLVTCLNGYERGRMEHHHYMFTLGYYGNSLYIIGCPGSYYCRVKKEDYGRLVYNPSKDDLKRSLIYRQKFVKHMTSLRGAYRINATSLFEEVTLQNYVMWESSFIMSEIGEDGKMVM
ncbi:protein O-linked-mannose beta-1,2-N-acetylglucosaminyltransferase 1-like [Macrobrachium rosenbergii]|uniref:protein O-linked-mannose beta-1,2-N-acetylglucosaminyltransferase 1-like n=1 Tax=Macrobrachium rosenbergii TaxID=79674 RepID=UPI0034D3ABCE